MNLKACLAKTRYLRAWFAALALTLAFSNSLWAQVDSLSTALQPGARVQQRYSGSIGFYHANGFVDDADPSSLVDFIGSYRWSKKHRTTLRQWVLKKYKVDPGESEVELLDPWIRHYYQIDWKPLGINMNLRGQLTLPTSEYSRRNDVLTRPELRLFMTKGFWRNKIMFTLSPSFTYHLNRYRTTDDSGLAGRQRSLVQYRYGSGFSMMYRPVSKLTLSFSGLWERVHFEQSQRVNDRSTIGATDLPRHRYWFGAGASYLVDRHWIVGVSTSQLSFAEQNGRADVFVFDPYTTQLSFDMTYNF